MDIGLTGKQFRCGRLGVVIENVVVGTHYYQADCRHKETKDFPKIFTYFALVGVCPCYRIISMRPT